MTGHSPSGPATERLAALTAELGSTYPIIANGLLANRLEADDPRWVWAQRALEHVERITGGDRDRLDACLEAFAYTSIDFLRLQARFLKTGVYALSDSTALVDELYGQADEMQPYLDGLALTYAMWPNHASLLGFFVESFIPAVPVGGRVIEIGPGHGLFATTLLTERPDLTYLGIDISPTSVAYSRQALTAAGVDDHRYELHVGDARSLVDLGADGDGLDGLICCEVLEHVDDPLGLLVSMRTRLTPGAPAFLTTVANLEAIDHVYLFDNEAEISDTIAAAGFSIADSRAFALPGSEQAIPLPLNYAAIASA